MSVQDLMKEWEETWAEFYEALRTRNEINARLVYLKMAIRSATGRSPSHPEKPRDLR